MTEYEIDLLSIDRGTVTAPAGCGKTHLIAQSLTRHSGNKPILILTHTNAGVASLRSKLDKEGVLSRKYRLSTIDGWAMRLVGMFPYLSAIDSDILALKNPKRDYPAIRCAAVNLLKQAHIRDIIAASYERIIVDEYQDCSVPQHALVCFASHVLPTCVLGDPMQAIFGWNGNALADWDKHVCTHFPIAGELNIPWRWKNAGNEEFGMWLLDLRKKLIDGVPVDLTKAPSEITFVCLDGKEDRKRQLLAARTRAISSGGSVLVIGKSTSPPSQRDFASQTPGAVTIENVDLRDFINFAEDFDFHAEDALEKLVNFASTMMTNVGPSELLSRVSSLERGRARKAETSVERVARNFLKERSANAATDLLVEIGKDSGVRTYRPAVMRACIKALQACRQNETAGFYDAAVCVREQNRLLGRSLPKRAVGSTLLLKGLEAEVSVILDADDLDARNLYVAMTRGSCRLVVCAKSSTIVRRC